MGRLAQEIAPFDGSIPGAVLQVGLLGPLTLTRDGTPLQLSGPKRRALLILLALHAGVPLGRDRIVEALWPEQQTGREEATLRFHVSHLRDVLEPARDAPPNVLVTRGAAYMLDAEHVDVDTARFERLARQGHTLLSERPDTALDVLNEALGLWRGRPLQDVEYDEFAQEAIRWLERTRVDAVESRAEALVELGEDGAAIEDLEVLARTDPTRERPACLLMQALYRTGRQSDALRVARRHIRALAEQGLDPSPRVDLLQERMLRHDPTLLPDGVVPAGEIKPGRSVRGYELREEVGAGTIGTVYRAFQASVGREVAVKVIHPRLAEAPEFVRRFAEEARVIAGLEHPHIVPLHDFWRDPAGAFLVMRWLDGGTMASRLAHPWETADLGRAFDQLADALGYAHSAGVFHRDLKAANVLFDSSDNAYLGDFGLPVTGIGTGTGQPARPATIRPHHATLEVLHREQPSVASEVFGLGMLLAQAASAGEHRGGDTPFGGGIGEVVRVATASAPGDRYPDMQAFRSALREAIGTRTLSVPRRVRRNPYKGLLPFDEADRADFYGRDDVVETLVAGVGANGLTAVIGASGSGKSSVVMAGLIPQLRDGALPGSDEWSIVRMVPGTDPFDEFHLGLRSTAVGHPMTLPDDRLPELRTGFAAALDGPSSRALLIVDQFEELFSSQVDESTRARFLDNLADLAVDPSRRVRVVLTLRADFADRPLAHPRFGDLMSRASLLLAPMLPEQVEDVVRRPAARVGVQIEPGLIAEVVRDVTSAPAYLPLLQYVLSELFERRTEDRLTVHAYRALGGVQGVLERRAEATFASLGTSAQHACRQLFLRMVHLGDNGEETRRRLPLTELHGLGGRAAVDEALEAFSAARLLTYDRDPVTRTPTVEIAHETVIGRWTRYRVWLDEARADLLAHRRLSAAATTWAAMEEDPSFLLIGGPLASALEVASADRVNLNAL
jgi:DNA-binding SARP family transcriptional activator/serine/threonine protein kinase